LKKKKRNKKSSSPTSSAPVPAPAPAPAPLSLERLTGTWNLCEARSTILVNSAPEAEFLVLPTLQCISNTLNITALNTDHTSFKLEYSLPGQCSVFGVTGTKNCVELNTTMYNFVYIGTQSLNPRKKDQHIMFTGGRVEYQDDNGEFLLAPEGKEFGTVEVDLTTLSQDQQTIYTDWNIRDLFQDPKREVFKVRTWKLVKDLSTSTDCSCTSPTTDLLTLSDNFYIY